MLQATLSLSSEINAYMSKSGVPNHRWYVGITSDIKGRLFGYHNVTYPGGWLIYRQCASASEARDLEAAYHNAGCKGSTGGGGRDCCFIYAYLITPTTVE
jgi:hypothetical protein